MSKEEAIELLTDVSTKCDVFRDVLEKLELQLQDLLPPLNTGTATGYTTEDTADYIENARNALEDAARIAEMICGCIEEEN